MPRAPANGIEIEYETFGDASRPAMLLVMGLGIQLLGWDERFCKLLADRGFHVIRFDNRDVGLSSKMDSAPMPDLMALFGGDTRTATYTLDDMAEDSVGLLDHLGIGAAHVVGVSLGGMVAQTLAIQHQERLLSLTSIMSTTGDLSVGQPLPSALPALMGLAPTDREDRESLIEHQAGLFKLIASPAYPPDESWLRAVIGASYDRSNYPAGFARQLAAVLASGDRTEALGKISVPALVIHGDSDPLITPSGGEATAAAIPDARLIKIEGMGHDLPPQLWDRLVDAIVDNASRAGAAQPATAD